MRGFSEGAIELYGVMSFRESNMNAAVVEQLREIVGQERSRTCRRSPAAWTSCRAPSTRTSSRTSASAPRSRPSSRIPIRSPSTTRDRPAARQVTGDYAICAIPFSVLRDIEILGTGFSRPKQKAIRELNYNASGKILFQTRHRFWEREDGIVGGTTVTDLPIRRICYPSYSDPDDERGTLLASYTWGQDALRWGAMDAEDAIEQALEDVAQIHPSITTEFEVGAVAELVRRPVRQGRLRAVRTRAADAAPGGDRRARGPDPFRRRAHVAVPRVDPGSARVGHPGGQGDPRGKRRSDLRLSGEPTASRAAAAEGRLRREKWRRFRLPLARPLPSRPYWYASFETRSATAVPRIRAVPVSVLARVSQDR